MLIAALPSDPDGLSLVGLPDSVGDLGQAELVFVRTGQPDADGRRPRQARRIITACLDVWGLRAHADDAVLLVSELVTNAFRYGVGETVQVRFYLTEGYVCIEVQSRSEDSAGLEAATVTDESGRGLWLVDAVADAWGVMEDNARVWCIIRRDPGAGSRFVRESSSSGHELQCESPVPYLPQPQLGAGASEYRSGVLGASETTVMRVLEALRPVQASAVIDAIFDTLNDILGPDCIPNDDEIPDLSLRMRGYLMRLLGVVPEHGEFTDLVRTARALLDEEVPGGYLAVRVHLRRMALAALGLLDHLAPLPAPSR
ncbi:DUF6415 family natural product biosynthesis protein [Streptomyces sp. NPDC088748]|uniref:DUF6415 family natural product biosynthesis protein n=1 Tax=Streptomyces sp. NPDC088748 TaxID=3365887 RepID=UPI0038078A00